MASTESIKISIYFVDETLECSSMMIRSCQWWLPWKSDPRVKRNSTVPSPHLHLIQGSHRSTGVICRSKCQKHAPKPFMARPNIFLQNSEIFSKAHLQLKFNHEHETPAKAQPCPTWWECHLLCLQKYEGTLHGRWSAMNNFSVPTLRGSLALQLWPCLQPLPIACTRGTLRGPCRCSQAPGVLAVAWISICHGCHPCFV